MTHYSYITLRHYSPREAWLNLADITEKEPKYISKAYQQTQPKTVFHEISFEQEQEEFKKRQKTG